MPKLRRRFNGRWRDDDDEDGDNDDDEPGAAVGVWAGQGAFWYGMGGRIIMRGI